METRLDRLQQDLTAMGTEVIELNAKATKEDRDFTDAEETRYRQLIDVSIPNLRKRIDREKSDHTMRTELEQLHAKASAPAPAKPGGREDADEPIALDATRSVFDVVRKRGVKFATDPGADQMSLGRIIRAIAFGDKRGLSDVEIRALSEGTDAAGGFTTPEILGAQFIDRLRPALVTARAGALTIPLESDTVHIARVATGVTPLAWKLENAAITESAITLERVTFSAKTLPCLVKMSVELAEDSANIDTIIQRELSAALAAELDRVALRGSGTAPEPKGIRFQTGVTLQASGVDGAALTYDPILDAGFAVLGANVETVKVVFNARSAKSLAKLKEATTNAYLTPPAAFTAWGPPLVTNAIPINLTTGTSVDTSEVYVGDFRELLIGLRTSFRLEVSRQAADATSSAFSNLQVWVRCYLRADIQVGHPAAFVVILGVRP